MVMVSTSSKQRFQAVSCLHSGALIPCRTSTTTSSARIVRPTTSLLVNSGIFPVQLMYDVVLLTRTLNLWILLLRLLDQYRTALRYVAIIPVDDSLDAP